MNKQLQKFARDTIKQALLRCSEEQQTLFKRMYSLNLNPAETPIDDVVDDMDESKLDWAMQQVQATLDESESGDFTIPSEMIVTRESWEKIVNLVKNPPEPTEALKKLFGIVDDC